MRKDEQRVTLTVNKTGIDQDRNLHDIPGLVRFSLHAGLISPEG